MARTTYFDSLKNRLLNRRWIAIPLLVAIAIGGTVKLWNDLKPLVLSRGEPTLTSTGSQVELPAAPTMHSDTSSTRDHVESAGRKTKPVEEKDPQTTKQRSNDTSTSGRVTADTRDQVVTDAEPSAEQLSKELRPVYFLVGSARISEESAKRLEQYVEILGHHPYKYLSLESHTRPVSPVPNMNLARARGEAVGRLLKELGVPPQKIRIVEFGGALAEQAPTDEYRDRVEIVVAWL